MIMERLRRLACTTIGLACLLAQLSLAAHAAASTTSRTAQPPASAQAQDGAFDWLAHTDATLAALKQKLNLKAEQLSAWDTWSVGVRSDAQRQLASGPGPRRRAAADERRETDETTPERMVRMTGELRADLEWMREHLAALEAAADRTAAVYGILGTDQRTIFDLFWRETLHRAAAHLPGREAVPCGRCDAMPGTHGPADGRDRD